MKDASKNEPPCSGGGEKLRDSAPVETATASHALSSRECRPDAGSDAPVDGVIEVDPVIGSRTDNAVPAGGPTGTPSNDDTEDAPRDDPDPLAEIRDQLVQLTEETAKHHERASQRESVIDSMHGELEQLRRGERRSLLRPLVTEVCRLRDDLLRQADTLPADFDQRRASLLLRNYADSLEFTLEDNGITTFAPEVGEPFQARLHRVASKAPTRDSALVGTIAAVVSPGYRDIEANAVIASARVAVHVADETEPEHAPSAVTDAADGGTAAGIPEPTRTPTNASADGS